MKIICATSGQWSTLGDNADLQYELATWPPLVKLMKKKPLVTYNKKAQARATSEAKTILENLCAYVKEDYDTDLGEFDLEAALEWLELVPVKAPWRIVEGANGETVIEMRFENFSPVTDKTGAIVPQTITPQEQKRLGYVL